MKNCLPVYFLSLSSERIACLFLFNNFSESIFDSVKPRKWVSSLQILIGISGDTVKSRLHSKEKSIRPKLLHSYESLTAMCITYQRTEKRLHISTNAS